MCEQHRAPLSHGEQTGRRHSEGLVRLSESLAPSTIGSIYLTGSYAFDAALSTSDIDRFFVGRPGQVDDALKAKVFSINQTSSLICPLRLDVKIYGHEELEDLDAALAGPSEPWKKLLHFNAVTIKTASRADRKNKGCSLAPWLG